MGAVISKSSSADAVPVVYEVHGYHELSALAKSKGRKFYFESTVLGDYSIIESEREGMAAGPEPTAYGLFADFVNAVLR